MDQKAAEAIRKLIPIEKGAPFSMSKEQKEAWCIPIKESRAHDDITCSLLTFNAAERYYLVYITPKNKKNNFREIPKTPKNIHTALPKKLLEVYKTFAERDWDLIKRSITENVHHAETYDKGYFDYSDPVLHDLVQQLIKLVPRYQNTIFNVLHYSKNQEEREIAAHLLFWAIAPSTLDKVIKLDLLNDPSSWVRNYVGRAMLSIVPKVKDPLVLEQATKAFCKQIEIPDHTDKNKGLFTLKMLLKQNPEVRTLLSADCMRTINDIAEQSILDNVGGIAKSIQQLLKEPPNV